MRGNRSDGQTGPSGYESASRDRRPWLKRPLSAMFRRRIPEYIDMAFRTAMSGRPGPVYLELPCNVLNATVDPAMVKKMHTTVDSKPVDRENTRKVVDLLKAAKNPIVIAGSGVWYADAEKELVEFVEKAGIPAFTAGAGRGVITRHPPPLL
ncbi:MAG: thiamine pyrophosphate-binding protein [Desulfobacterales bacterium]|nr:thiamine pyrophosphate-binding protein [Desulfobacterales bacterium]